MVNGKNKEGLSVKRAWIVFAVTAAYIVPTRIWAMFRFADPKTGFYTDGGWTVGILSVFLAVCAAAILVLSARSRLPGASGEPMRSVPAAISGAAAGVAVALQSAVSLAVPAADAGALDWIFALCGILAAAALLTAAYGFASGGAPLRRLPVLALMPSVWGCLGMVLLFIRYAATVNRLENLYHTCTAAFLLLFLFSQAKLLTGIDSAKSGRRVFGYGLAAATLTAATAVPNLALYFSGRGTLGLFPTGLHAANLFLAAYALCYLAAAGRRAGAPAAFPAAREDAPAEGRPGGEETDGEPDVLKSCADFLNSRYGWEEKFVGAAENARKTAENGKG
ncbi:MAG TPA: hypothetical protein DEB16_08315 [Ruminococcaceae bacterium]|nr:hypothetical protein [Oscillospiraceae bacterium]